jgi:predicted transglutaminase-like cysteine proteinase
MGQASRRCTRIFSKRLAKGAAQVAFTLVLCAAALSGAHAEELVLPPIVPAVPTSLDPAYPTAAGRKFCERHGAECAIDYSEPETITLTPETWKTLRAVNHLANTIITPVTDRKHWGVEDRWDYPDDGRGDCEDIQLFKRKVLFMAGLPRRALRMTVVLDETRSGHAVMMVRTDRGDFILDNKIDAVLPWNETGYEFLKREGAEGTAWVALSRQPIAVATANR